MQEQREIYADEDRYYRSYLNSLLVTNAGGRQRILIPRFEPVDEKEQEWMAEVEAKVENAYRTACPDAELVWIPSDVMARMGGAVHCTTHLIPDWEAMQGESN